jgi:tetratricopeptide (TPR) repeat protein
MIPKRPRKFWLLSSFAAILLSTGCSYHTDRRMQEGRTALLAGRPEEALNYFNTVAEDNPNYQTSNALHESIWTYLGRAYYETGKYAEARKALDQALVFDPNDSMARLYLGMTLTRSNDRDRGLVEMQTGLNGIHVLLDSLAVENVAISYWDPNKQIRKLIESGLAGKPSAIELIVTAQRVGKLVEEEIDRERRDRARVQMRN